MIIRCLIVCSILIGAVGAPGTSAQDQLQAERAGAEPQTDQLSIKLIDPGQQPWRELRYHPQSDSITSVVMSMDMEQQSKVAGAPAPSNPIPTQEFTIEYRIGKVREDGSVQFDFTYTDARVVTDPKNPSPAATMMQQALQPLIGLTGTSVVDDRGSIESADVDIPENAPPMVKTLLESMRQSMKNMSSPLPEAPVGVGAKWVVSRPLDMNGMSLSQTGTHELTAIDGDRITLAVTIKQIAQPQEIKSPMLPPGAKMKLKSLETKGRGDLVIDLNTVVPQRSSMDTQTDNTMEINAGGQVQLVSSSTKIKMTLKPAPEK